MRIFVRRPWNWRRRSALHSWRRPVPTMHSCAARCNRFLDVGAAVDRPEVRPDASGGVLRPLAGALQRWTPTNRRSSGKPGMRCRRERASRRRSAHVAARSADCMRRGERRRSAGLQPALGVFPEVGCEAGLPSGAADGDLVGRRCAAGSAGVGPAESGSAA